MKFHLLVFPPALEIQSVAPLSICSLSLSVCKTCSFLFPAKLALLARLHSQPICCTRLYFTFFSVHYPKMDCFSLSHNFFIGARNIFHVFSLASLYLSLIRWFFFHPSNERFLYLLASVFFFLSYFPKIIQQGRRKYKFNIWFQLFKENG